MTSPLVHSSRPRHRALGVSLRALTLDRWRPLDGVERALVLFEGLVSVCGLGGGLFMATHPLTVMPLSYLEGTWFYTWRWPGVALFFFVGVAPAVVVAATLRLHPLASVGHLAVGVGLMAWILLEAAWVIVEPPLQIAFGLMGALITVLAVQERRRRGRYHHD